MDSPAAHPALSDERLGRMVRLLRGWEARAEATLPERLASAMIELFEQGEVFSGFRIPSERRLAEALAISRGTVTAAYRRLRLEGWVGSRVGSGSKVLSLKGRPVADRTRLDGRLATHQRRAGGPLDLTSGALPALPLTGQLALSAVESRLPGLLDTDGYEPQGMFELRQEVARYYQALGAATAAGEVVITTGSQQALHLLADAFLAPGDTVLVEDPTFRGAIEAFRGHGAKLVPIPLGFDGPDTGALEQLVRRLRPRIVYLLPIAHNPTGHVVSRFRAAAIARILSASDAMFIEDGTPADLVLERSKPPTPVGVGVPPDRWVAIGSASKLFWGGLRVGWIRGSEAIVQRIARIKAVADLGSSLVSQAIAVECLRVVDRAREERRGQLRASLQETSELLGELAPDWQWERPQGGSALWVKVPDTDTRALAELARRFGVSVVPGAFFSPVDGFTDRLRIPFWVQSDSLRAGLQALVSAWRNQRAR